MSLHSSSVMRCRECGQWSTEVSLEGVTQPCGHTDGVEDADPLLSVLTSVVLLALLVVALLALWPE